MREIDAVCCQPFAFSASNLASVAGEDLKPAAVCTDISQCAVGSHKLDHMSCSGTTCSLGKLRKNFSHCQQDIHKLKTYSCNKTQQPKSTRIVSSKIDLQVQHQRSKSGPSDGAKCPLVRKPGRVAPSLGNLQWSFVSGPLHVFEFVGTNMRDLEVTTKFLGEANKQKSQ